MATASVNKFLAIGNLCHDPEMKYTPQGTANTTFALALNRSYKDKGSGEDKEEVCYVDVQCWGKLAENVAEYCKKGKQVFVEGYLKQDRWEDKKTGQKRQKLYVTAEQVKFLGGKDAAKEPLVVPDTSGQKPEEDVPW